MNFEKNGLTRRDALIAALGVSGTFALGGCQLLGLEWQYRYRLIVAVEVSGKLITGSSVIEVTRTWGPTGIDGTSRGEAVTVDLPSGRALFALLRGDMAGIDWPFTMPHWAFADRLGGTNMVDPALLDKLVDMRGATATLSPTLFPLLATFRDIGDPKSITRVDPNDVGKSLGHNVTLRGIAVQITNGLVTRGIDRRLVWLTQPIQSDPNFHPEGIPMGDFKGLFSR